MCQHSWGEMNTGTNQRSPEDCWGDFRKPWPPHSIGSGATHRFGRGGSHVHCAAPSPAVFHESRSLECFVDCWFENRKSWPILENEQSILGEYENVCTPEDHATLFTEASLWSGLLPLNQNLVVKAMCLRRKETYFSMRLLAILTHSQWLWAGRRLKYI